MPNLNYPDYGMGFGGMAPQAPAPTAPAAGGFMSSVLPYVAPVTGLLGVASSAYGGYLASQEADRQYEESMRRYNAEMARQAKMDTQAQQQQSLQNSLATGNYAANRSADVTTPFVNYSRALGR